MSILERFYESILDRAEPVIIPRKPSPMEMLARSLLGSTSLSPAKLGRDDLRIYQTRVIDIMKGIWTDPASPPGAIIALEPGAGKTVSSLTAISELLAAGHISKPLIVAPLLVAETVWDAEIEEWSHLNGMTCSKILGNERRRIDALDRAADIYIINKENLVWLWNHLDRGKNWCFDALFIDEASMLKNGKKRTMKRSLTRFGALAAARKYITGVVELTGTPAPNGLKNLWGLAYIVDQGERLGRTKAAFEQRWFNQNKYTYEVKPKSGAQQEIMSKLTDIMFSLNPDDYASLPPLIENDITVHLPPKALEEYRRFKRTLVSEEYDVEAVNAAVLTNKLLQFANGSLFQEDGNHVPVHDEKLKALVDLHEEANGTPMLVAYSYRFDLERIRRKFPKAVVLNEQKDVVSTVRQWNEGEIDLLLAHPASAGHGLNIQRGSNISVWYGLTADLELFQQFNKRLWRSGQKREVVWSHRIIAADTHDMNILPILNNKDSVQSEVLKSTEIELYR